MRFGQAYLLLLSVLLAAVPAVADAGGGSCVVQSGERLSQSGAPRLAAIAPSSRQAPYRLSFDCRDGAVAGVQLRSIPGEAVEARFLLNRRESAVAEIEWDEDALSSSSRILVETSGRGSEVTLRIDVPASARPGSVQSARLLVRDRQAGDDDAFSLDIPLMLEIVESGPLFRDDFDPVPDPVIGQFSMVGH